MVKRTPRFGVLVYVEPEKEPRLFEVTNVQTVYPVQKPAGLDVCVAEAVVVADVEILAVEDGVKLGDMVTDAVVVADTETVAVPVLEADLVGATERVRVTVRVAVTLGLGQTEVMGICH